MGFGKFIKDEGISESLQIGTQDYGYISEASFSAGKLKKISELYGNNSVYRQRHNIIYKYDRIFMS